MDDLDFKAFFTEKVRARGLTLKKLSDLSGIAIQHLENMATGRYDRLPPAPYLKGYLKLLGQILDFDPQVWIDNFVELGVVKSSGIRDQITHNRYQVESLKRYAWGTMLLLAILGYGIFRFSAIVGRPSLVVLDPKNNTSQTNNASYVIRGTANRSDGVTVNGETTGLDEFGAWQKEVMLQPGVNIVEVRAKKFLGSEVLVSKQIIYEPPVELPEVSERRTPLPEPIETEEGVIPEEAL